jgi:steroid delta-isomerase-like uncharacterized protein
MFGTPRGLYSTANTAIDNRQRRTYVIRKTFMAIGLLAVVGCAAPPPPDYAAQRKAALDAYLAGWSEGKVDGLDAVLAPSFARRSSAGMSADGIPALKKVMTDIRTAYPDLKVVFDESYHMKDVSFHLWTATGTNTGPGAAPPTGKSIKVPGMTLVRYQDGRIASEVVRMDVLDWYTQLGYTLAPPAGAAPAPAASPAPKK